MLLLLEEKRSVQGFGFVHSSVCGISVQRHYEQVNLADCCSTAVCTCAHIHFLSERKERKTMIETD